MPDPSLCCIFMSLVTRVDQAKEGLVQIHHHSYWQNKHKLCTWKAGGVLYYTKESL